MLIFWNFCMDKVVIHSSTNRRWCRGRSSMTWKWRRLISSCQESMWQCRLTSSRHIRLTGTSAAGETERFVALTLQTNVKHSTMPRLHAIFACKFENVSYGFLRHWLFASYAISSCARRQRMVSENSTNHVRLLNCFLILKQMAHV